MESEINNTQSAPTGDLVGNAVQQTNANDSQQARVGVQSPANALTDREKFLLNEAFKQSQRLVSKSETRQSSQFQGMIDKFKADYGVTLTEQQAQEMAANQYARSMPNDDSVGQQNPQQAQTPEDQSYAGFRYYFGIDQDNPIYRQCFDVQRTLGIELEKNDPEFYTLTHPEQKYQPAEFVQAWKQACISKMMRLQSQQQDNSPATNMGQMPLIGSKGNKSNPYDPRKEADEYFTEYFKGMKLQ